MRPTDAAIKAAYRDSTVPLRAWAERAGLTLSMLRPHIVRLGLTGRRPSHRGGRPRRLSDAELLAIWHDPRPLAEIGAAMTPPLGQTRLSAMLGRLGLGRRAKREGAARLEGVGVSASVADARKCAAGQVLETPARRLRQPADTGVTR